MNFSSILKTAASTALIAVSMTACNEKEIADLLAAAEDSGRNAELDLDAINLPQEAIDDATIDTVGKSGCAITESQERMLAEINLARAQARLCGDESFASAPAVTWGCQLEQAAWIHTGDMVEHNFFSHTGSDGLNAGNRVDATGYNWKVYGENLAAGFITEKKTVEGLLESPGHCKNMMNPKFKEVGTARIFTEDKDYISYWTHVFGTSF